MASISIEHLYMPPGHNFFGHHGRPEPTPRRKSLRLNVPGSNSSGPACLAFSRQSRSLTPRPRLDWHQGVTN